MDCYTEIGGVEWLSGARYLLPNSTVSQVSPSPPPSQGPVMALPTTPHVAPDRHCVPWTSPRGPTTPHRLAPSPLPPPLAFRSRTCTRGCATRRRCSTTRCTARSARCASRRSPCGGSTSSSAWSTCSSSSRCAMHVPLCTFMYPCAYTPVHIPLCMYPCAYTPVHVPLCIYPRACSPSRRPISRPLFEPTHPHPQAHNPTPLSLILESIHRACCLLFEPHPTPIHSAPNRRCSSRRSSPTSRTGWCVPRQRSPS